MIDLPRHDPVVKFSVSLRRSQYRALEVICAEQKIPNRSGLIQDAVDLYLGDEHGKHWAERWLPRAYRDFKERVAELAAQTVDEWEEVA